MKNQTNLEDVRAVLMDTLRDLCDRSNPMDIGRARAVADVASVMVDTARVENEYLKITGQDRSEFIGLPDVPKVLPNGITAITRHRLEG